MAGDRQVKISILGDAKGGVAALNETGSASDGLIGKLGSMGAIVGGVALAGVAALGALGVGAFKLGATFDDAYDTIRLGTGKTGEVLETLQEDFKAVVSNVPTDFGTASTAIADLNTRLGLTGEPLQDLTTQMINLANVSGKEIGPLIASTTRLFGDWSIATADQADTLDTLWKVSQNTGIGVDTLAEKVVQFGAPLRQMGFSFEESAAMIGKWEKEGVNAELVLGSLRIALGNFARDGVTDTKEALEGYIEAIQKAGSTGEANAIAMEIFGAKAGPDMAAAIREGRFEIDDLLKILDESPETINGAAAATADLAESWTLLKNKAMVALEPIGNAVFGLASDLVKRLIPAMDRVSAVMKVWAPRIVGFVLSAIEVFQRFGSYVVGVVSAVIGAFGKLRSGEITLAQFIGGIKTLVATILGDLFNLSGSGDLGAGSFMAKAAGFLRTAMPIVLNELAILGRAFGSWVQTVAIPYLQEHLPQWLTTLSTWVTNTALPAIWGVVSSVGAAFGGWIGGTAIPYLRTNLPLWLAAISTWVSTVAVPAVGGYLYAVGTAFGDWVATRAVPWVQANFPGWLKAVTDWITNVAAPEAGRFLVAVGTAFGDWVATKAVPYLIEKIPQWLTALENWITNTAVPAIATKAGELATALLAWITSEETGKQLDTYVGTVQDKLGGEEGGLLHWLVNDWAPKMGAQLHEWIFFETMGEKLGRLKDDTMISLDTLWNETLPWAVRMAVSLGSWLEPVARDYANWHVQTTADTLGWMSNLLGKIGPWSLQMGDKLIDWLAKGVPIWISKLIEANNALDKWTGDQLRNLGTWATSVGTKLAEVVTSFGDLPGEIVTAVGDLSKTLSGAGAALMSGFVSGVASKAKEAVDIVRDAVQKIRDLLPGSEPKDASSPLRGLSDAGEAIMGNIATGIRLGLGGSLATIRDVLGTMTGVILEGLPTVSNPAATEWEKLNGASYIIIERGLEIWEKLRQWTALPRTMLRQLFDDMTETLAIGEQLYDQANALKESAAYYANEMKDAFRFYTEGMSIANQLGTGDFAPGSFNPRGGNTGTATVGQGFDPRGGSGGGAFSPGNPGVGQGGTPAPIININAPVYGVNHFDELLRAADQRNSRRGG